MARNFRGAVLRSAPVRERRGRKDDGGPGRRQSLKQTASDDHAGVTRMPRMQGFPPITSWLNVILSSVFIRVPPG